MTAPFLISADSHVLEPPDIWTSRLPAKFQDRAPKQEYHLALIRAYNDWLSDYCAVDPERYIGLALVPSGGDAKAAADEIYRAMKLPGMRGVQINKYPTTGQRLHPDDDVIFQACVDTGAAAPCNHACMVQVQEGDQER